MSAAPECLLMTLSGPRRIDSNPWGVGVMALGLLGSAKH
jgi:hypothetical protein